jgi:hypothetical protein
MDRPPRAGPDKGRPRVITPGAAIPITNTVTNGIVDNVARLSTIVASSLTDRSVSSRVPAGGDR